MAFKNFNSIQYQHKILLIALLVSLSLHVFLVLFSPNSPVVIQASSSTRMSVSTNWNSYDVPKIKPVKIEQKDKPLELIENTYKTKQISVGEKSVITSKANTDRNKITSSTKVKKDIKEIQDLIAKPLETTNITPKKFTNNVSENIKTVDEVVELSQAVMEHDIQTASVTQKSEQSSSSDSLNVAKQNIKTRYQLGSNDNPSPSYPTIARKRGWEGEVILGVHVRADGSIEHLTFVKSTDYGVLNFEAYETVRTSWQFKPLEGNTHLAESAYIEVPITFQIANR